MGYFFYRNIVFLEKHFRFNILFIIEFNVYISYEIDIWVILDCLYYYGYCLFWI